MAAGLWHVAWWIGVVFIVMTLISANIVLFSMLLNRTQRDAGTKAREAREQWKKIDPQQKVDWQKHYREWIAQQRKEKAQEKHKKSTRITQLHISRALCAKCSYSAHNT